MSLAEHEPELREIAADVGVTLQVGGPVIQGAEVIGSPPAEARLMRGQDGQHIVRVPLLSAARDFELVLHELAHHHLGMRETYDEEAECFAWAAVQALRLPVEVSTEVASMAKEALS